MCKTLTVYIELLSFETFNYFYKIALNAFDFIIHILLKIWLSLIKDLKMRVCSKRQLTATIT